MNAKKSFLSSSLVIHQVGEGPWQSAKNAPKIEGKSGTKRTLISLIANGRNVVNVYREV